MLNPRNRYIPPRKVERQAPGKRMPRKIQEFATMYESGMSLQRIALDTGWRPGRNVQPAGAFSPSSVRTALREWGVVLRRSGGRGSTKGSILVRVSELEKRVADLERFWPRP